MSSAFNKIQHVIFKTEPHTIEENFHKLRNLQLTSYLRINIWYFLPRIRNKEKMSTLTITIVPCTGGPRYCKKEMNDMSGIAIKKNKQNSKNVFICLRHYCSCSRILRMMQSSYGWPLKNTGGKALISFIIQNPHITFDSHKTTTNSLLLTKPYW